MKRLIAIFAVTVLAMLCASCQAAEEGGGNLVGGAPGEVSNRGTTAPTLGNQTTETLDTVPTTVPILSTQPSEPNVTQPITTVPVQPDYDEPLLLPEVEQAMKAAYLSKYVEGDGYSAADATIAIRYYGEYEGAHVAFVDCNLFMYIDSEVYETIGGLEFRYTSGQKLLVYRDGDYLELSKAYDAGWLSDNALANLLEYYKLVKYFMYLE